MKQVTAFWLGYENKTGLASVKKIGFRAKFGRFVPESEKTEVFSKKGLTGSQKSIVSCKISKEFRAAFRLHKNSMHLYNVVCREGMFLLLFITLLRSQILSY
jgi:hypothetical protein